MPGGAKCSIYILGICRWRNHEPDQAEAALKESIRLFAPIGNKWFMFGGCLTGLAGVASSRGNMEQAARLMGIAEKGIYSIGGANPPFWLRDYHDPLIAFIHAHLDYDRFETAWQEGYSMPSAQVFSFTLELAKE